MTQGHLDLDSDASGATFDPTRTWRYTLWRRWDARRPDCVWLMLNPSTADETELDPTIRRCVGFTRSWGLHGGIVVVNLFAVRSTNPTGLLAVDDPIGAGNDAAIFGECKDRRRGVICAWGNGNKSKALMELVDRRAAEVRKLLRGRTLQCLGTTGRGHPRHPLYLAATTELQRYGVGD